MEETSDTAQVQQREDKPGLDQSECIVTQPTANGILPHHYTDQAPPLGSDRSEDISSGGSMTDSLSSNDAARLLPGPASSSQPQTETDLPKCSSCGKNGCTVNHHRQKGANRRPAPSQSPASYRIDAAHIQQAAAGDCCVHCLLACLFCELPSLCSVLGRCLLCGVGGACAEEGGACCCCSDALIGCGCLETGCTEDAFGALSDCGIIETCCGSSDCLEICLECCSICFPS